MSKMEAGHSLSFRPTRNKKVGGGGIRTKLSGRQGNSWLDLIVPVWWEERV